MTFQENETIYLLSEDGKKHWMKVSFGMLRISSLGTLDGSRLRDLDDGKSLTIAGMRFTAFRPGRTELMESLDRGAQIITPKDAATIIFNCDVKSGDSILEVGAGSGGLTTALISAVLPGGKVHTVEFKEENAQRALKNLRRTGYDRFWSYQIGDARTAKVDLTADALVMDMPDPENALDNLLPCLRDGGRVCAYIPNTNQLELIVNALRERDFADVIALENMQRGMEVHKGGVRPSFEMLGHTGYLVFGRKRSRRGTAPGTLPSLDPPPYRSAPMGWRSRSLTSSTVHEVNCSPSYGSGMLALCSPSEPKRQSLNTVQTKL